MTAPDAIPLYGQPMQARPGEVFAQCGWIDEWGQLYRLDEVPTAEIKATPVYYSVGFSGAPVEFGL